jgi:hypothetical protein
MIFTLIHRDDVCQKSLIFSSDDNFAMQEMTTQGLCGLCAILLRFYTSTERLKRVYTSPGTLLEIDYFR